MYARYDIVCVCALARVCMYARERGREKERRIKEKKILQEKRKSGKSEMKQREQKNVF